MPKDDFERLQLPNGIRLDENSMMEIEIAFDGETVTYRDEEGVLQDMDTLCYLDYVLRLFIRQLTDGDGNDLHPEGITPGHVLCHLVQHLHSQYHQVETNKQMAAFGELFAGEDGENPFTELGAYVLGPDGLKKVDLTASKEVEPTSAPVWDANVATDATKDATKDGDDDEGEIIVHGLPNGTKNS